MAELNYAKIYAFANSWALDPNVPAAKRNIAKALSELAKILADPNYGCPSEINALRLIGCHLCKRLGADICHHLENGECPLGLQTPLPLSDDRLTPKSQGNPRTLQAHCSPGSRERRSV